MLLPIENKFWSLISIPITNDINKTNNTINKTNNTINETDDIEMIGLNIKENTYEYIGLEKYKTGKQYHNIIYNFYMCDYINKK